MNKCNNAIITRTVAYKYPMKGACQDVLCFLQVMGDSVLCEFDVVKCYFLFYNIPLL